MKISRDFQRPFRFFIDQLLPPLIRDSRLFQLALWGILRTDTKVVWSFRRDFGRMSDEEVQQIYARLTKRALKVQTDLNESCIKRIRDLANKKDLLDVGCGTGALSTLLDTDSYTGIDFVHHQIWSEMESTSTKFFEGQVEQLPFDDKSFDLVVCAHVLEHVREPVRVLKELIRCSRGKVVVVLPRERSYVAGFNLHVHHFQYAWEVERLMNNSGVRFSVEEVDGDFFIELDVVS
jgi:SAM-dependent methyltransferase